MPEKPHIEFIRHIVEGLCQDRESITITDSIDERGVLILLVVAKTDAPRIIGKGGQTATAIRQLLRSLGGIHNARYSLKIEDTESVQL